MNSGDMILGLCPHRIQAMAAESLYIRQTKL